MSRDEIAAVFNRDARPAWRMALLLATVIGALAAYVAADHRLAIAAASEVIAPLDRKIDQHLAEMKPLREQMMNYVEEERAARKSMGRKLDALCRANPSAHCPLGD